MAFDDNTLPAQLGLWRRGTAIGAGGAGQVYLADHVETGVVGALKVSHAKLGAAARHWFRREAALAARLRHPYIVPLLDSGEFEERSFLVYEHAPGPTVAEVADQLDLEGIISVGRHLLEALTYAHDAGVVHCDITPSNVILTPGTTGRETRLIDFGLASARDERRGLQITSAVSGTPGYISPEQVRGQRVLGPSTDLFAVAALLFRLLCGYPRYAGAPTNALYLSAPLPFTDRFGLGEESPLAQVVLKLLAEDPERRYPSAAAARSAWAKAAESAPEGVPEPSAESPKPLVTVNTQLASTDSRLPEVRRSTPPVAITQRALVARRDVVAELAQRLHSSPEVSLCGPAGMGKSQVARELAARLESEMKVVRVCGRRDVESPPLECLASIVLGLLGAPDREPLWRSAERIHQLVVSLEIEDTESAEDALLGGLLGVGPSADARSAVMASVEVLQRMTAEPTLVVIDDADNVDASTWEVLAALVDSPLRVLRVLCSDSKRGPAPSDTSESVYFLPDFQSRDVLWQLFGGEGVPPEGTVADLRALGALKLDSAQPGAFHELPVDVAHALRAAHALGADIPERGLYELGASEATVHSLMAMGVLARVEHSCARHERWLRAPSAVLRRLALASLSEPQRAQTDLRPLAVRWLSRCCRDAPNTNLPRVARLAEGCGLVASAAYAWSEAGQLAGRAQRPTAARDLERALELNAELLSRGEDEAIDRPRVLAQLSAAHLAANRHTQADERAVEALEGLSDRAVLRTRLLRLRAQAAMAAMDNQLALTLLRQAVELIGSEGDPMESANAHAVLGWLLGYRMGRNEEGIALGLEALRIASRIMAPAFQASLCGRLGANYLRAGDWDGQLNANQRDLLLSSEGRDIYGQVRANINLGVCFTNRGALELAREHTDRAYVLGIRHGARAAASVAANNMALIASQDAQPEEAMLWIGRVAELSGGEIATETRLSEARVHMLRGDSAEARLVLARAAIQADHADKEHLARVGALIALADAKPEQAYEWTARALETPASDPYERATTQLTHSACLRAVGKNDEASALETKADASLRELGADVALERRRWTPQRD
ncbi:MAG: AAA family ATPase [Polyangiales bacterium]